jgi:hypothetical protein
VGGTLIFALCLIGGGELLWFLECWRVMLELLLKITLLLLFYESLPANVRQTVGGAAAGMGNMKNCSVVFDL